MKCSMQCLLNCFAVCFSRQSNVHIFSTFYTEHTINVYNCHKILTCTPVHKPVHTQVHTIKHVGGLNVLQSIDRRTHRTQSLA